MARILTIAASAIAAGLFAWAVPLERLFGAFQPLMVALSIMVAAVFIRLNRGMPTLEWQSLEPTDRSGLTSAIVRLTTEYGWIIAIIALTLSAIVTLSVIGTEAAVAWHEAIRRSVSGALGGALGLSFSRMAYVIWRDIDIVRLQKQLIDGVAAKEEDERQAALADEKVTEFKAANVRRVPLEKPKAWGE